MEQQRVLIYDTTLRDGTQAEGVSLSLEDKLMIAEKLDALGVDYIEGGYPLSNPKDKAFFKLMANRTMTTAKIAAFGMTRRKGAAAAEDAGMKALLDSRAPVITLVGKAWDLHVHDALRTTMKENLAMIAESVALMAADGRETIFDAEHFFDGWRANPDFALRCLDAAVESGAKWLVLCDTNGGSLPDFVRSAVEGVASRFAGVPVGVHCHNDSDLAVACSLAGVAGGATMVQGTVNGIGERCGNANLLSLAADLALKCGKTCLKPDSLPQLTAVSRYVDEVANLVPRDNQPFVGMAAFAHKGGMHVNAVVKNPATYEHVDPAAVGNHRKVLISELSGASNISAKADSKFNLHADRELQRKVLEKIQQMEHEGYQFEAADGSFEMLIRRTLGGTWYCPCMDLDHYRCVILADNDSTLSTEAIVKCRIAGHTVHTVAEGDGPVNALDAALRKALLPQYPTLDGLQLIDYKVRVVNARAGTAARVRVVIEFHDSACGYFGAVGVDENIIHASWRALIDGIEYKLLNEAERKHDGQSL